MTEEVSMDTGVPEINKVYHAVLEEKQTPPSQELYAYQKASQDYITIKGLELRTGAGPDEFGVFVLRELVDNALDFMERHAQRGNKCPNTTVIWNQ